MKRRILLGMLMFINFVVVGQTTRYEAEAADYTGNDDTWQVKDPSGGASVSFVQDQGHEVEFTVSVSETGTYDLTFAYISANDTNAGTIYVNGSDVGVLNLPHGVPQNNPADIYVYSDVSLNAGVNTIKYAHSYGWLTIDYMEINAEGEGGGEPVEPEDKLDQSAPSSKPTLSSETGSKVTLTVNTAYEFSMNDGSSWQSSNIFSGLSGNTTYSFVQRYASTATHNASPKSTSLSVTTGVAAEMSVWDKLQKGVNQDASLPSASNFEKTMHEPKHMETIATAGFTNVRFFIAYATNDFTTYRQRVQDALDNDLSVMICMWGPNGWATSGSAESQISTRWTAMAQWVEDEWPGEEDIVFELLNETSAIGFDMNNDAHNTQAMKLYGAAAKAVRSVSATRAIIISPPGYQDADKMSWVTKEKMSGYDFANDPNCGVSVHFYEPSSGPIGWFAMNEYPLLNPGSDDWKEPIHREIKYVTDWRIAQGVPNMPIVVTEWGFWTFPDRSANGDANLVAKYQAQYFRDNGIGGTWYTGMQSNNRAFAIFDTSKGWDTDVTPEITQQPVPTSWPSFNQFIDTEFEDWGSNTWKLLDGGSHSRVQFNNALSGTSSLKLDAGDVIYQRSFVGKVSAHVEVGENIEPRLQKYLLHLIQGETYTIGFKAKADAGGAVMKFRMKENLSDATSNGTVVDNKTGTTYHTSDAITISTSANTYEFTYTHNSATEWDVWFEFEVVSGSVTFDTPDLRNAKAYIGDATASVDSVSIQDEVVVYPNPFTSTLTLSGVKANDLVYVYSLQGVQLYTSVGVSKIDLSSLSPGIYFIKINDKAYKVIKK